MSATPAAARVFSAWHVPVLPEVSEHSSPQLVRAEAGLAASLLERSAPPPNSEDGEKLLRIECQRNEQAGICRSDYVTVRVTDLQAALAALTAARHEIAIRDGLTDRLFGLATEFQDRAHGVNTECRA